MLKGPDKYFYDFDKRDWRRNSWVYVPGGELVNRQTWDQPCCYVIYGDGVVVYVGQTNNFRQRVSQYNFQGMDGVYPTPWGTFSWFYAKAFFPSRYGYEAMMEKRFIKRLKPSGNRNMLSGANYGHVGKQRQERPSARKQAREA